MSKNIDIFNAGNTNTGKNSDWTPDFQQSLVDFVGSKNDGRFECVRVKWNNNGVEEVFNAMQVGSTRVGFSRNLDSMYHDTSKQPRELVQMIIANKDSLQVVSDSSFAKGGYILCKRGANVESATGSLI